MTKNIETAKGDKTVAIVTAAGSGIRMGSGRAKQFLDIDGRPLLAVTLQAFQQCGSVDAVVLVVPLQEVESCWKEIIYPFELDKVSQVVPGGERRQDSVRIGLEALKTGCRLVLIHDGVRPMIDDAFIERMVVAGKKHRAVIAALPAKETVKEVNGRKRVIKTYDREQVWLAQTPQVFRYDDILTAHQKALEEGWEEATDDSRLVEKVGIRVHVVRGSERNIKVTTPFDLEMARFLLTHPAFNADA